VYTIFALYSLSRTLSSSPPPSHWYQSPEKADDCIRKRVSGKPFTSEDHHEMRKKSTN
jgi:hypothetical protein